MKLVARKIKDTKFPEGLFDTMKTGGSIDIVFSNKTGIPKAVNYMVVGDPGVGKSTVTLDIIADLQIAGYKVAFISCEMSDVDLKEYTERYPKFANVPIIYPGELDPESYTDIDGNFVEGDDVKGEIEGFLSEGYDIVLIDSFVELEAIIREAYKLPKASTEKYILSLMAKHNRGDNKADRYTSFLAIQQVTKGGNFVGSNRLKHMTTGMMEIRFDDDSESNRYIMFSKNRRGQVFQKLFFDLGDPDSTDSQTGVNYDIEGFHERKNQAAQVAAMTKNQPDEKKHSKELFDNFFQARPKSERVVPRTPEEDAEEEVFQLEEELRHA